MIRPSTALVPVVSLQSARMGRRVSLARAQVEERLLEQRQAFDALCVAGLIHSARGTREGKRLLDAGVHLQRAASILKMLAGQGSIPAPRLAASLEEAHAEVDSRVEKADALMRRKPAELRHFAP